MPCRVPAPNVLRTVLVRAVHTFLTVPGEGVRTWKSSLRIDSVTACIFPYSATYSIMVRGVSNVRGTVRYGCQFVKLQLADPSPSAWGHAVVTPPPDVNRATVP